MSELVHQPSADASALAERRAELVGLREMLVGREVQLADLRARLRAFESKYMQQVGVLYAQLDDWDARIAEREVDLYDSAEARCRAVEARARATETHDAAYAPEIEPLAEPVDPPPSLKALFRELAKRIHPDFARDEAEQKHFTRLMARANIAYNRGDAGTLQRLLDDQQDTPAALHVEGSAAELTRLTRQVGHARRDLRLLDDEQAAMLSSDIAQLYRDAELAKTTGRDLLTELAHGLQEKVAVASRRFEFIDRQISAHGR